MRLQNFIIDVQNITPSTGDTSIAINSDNPGTREVQNDVYPWVTKGGDVNNNPLRVFQGSTQLAGSSFVSSITSGSVSLAGTASAPGSTLRMTSSLAAPVESDSTYQWCMFQVANSIYTG